MSKKSVRLKQLQKTQRNTSSDPEHETDKLEKA